jgi:hypothetical protein
MKTATVKELKEELNHLSQSELVELCLRLSRFKKKTKSCLPIFCMKPQMNQVTLKA